MNETVIWQHAKWMKKQFPPFGTLIFEWKIKLMLPRKARSYQPVYNMEQQSPHTWSQVHIHTSWPAQRQPGPLPLSLWPGLCIQARLCSISMAPYMWKEHKWASDQVKHRPCLFRSLAGKIHPSLSSQRPQFSSTLQSSLHVFINLSWV